MNGTKMMPAPSQRYRKLQDDLGRSDPGTAHPKAHPRPSQKVTEIIMKNVNIPVLPEGHDRAMKRRAVISDIHGNFEGLQAVLADIRKQDVDDIVCLGDVAGYGPEPWRCLKRLRSVTKWSLCGNHDIGLFMGEMVGFRPNAIQALKWHRSQMQPGLLSWPGKVARWRWLESMPSQRMEEGVLYVHASPLDSVTDYVLERDFKDVGWGVPQRARVLFDGFDRLCFVGHSHRPGVATHEYEWLKPDELDAMTYVLPKNEKTLVNVGSVGQPRDKNPDACYVIYDGETVRFRRVPYHLEVTQAKIRACAELDDFFGERLETGM